MVAPGVALDMFRAHHYTRVVRDIPHVKEDAGCTGRTVVDVLMNLLAPRDVDLLVDEHVARLHAPTPRPARSGMLRARVGQALISVGSALGGEVAEASARTSRPADPAARQNRQAA
jgi:hypothetical protein